uniref:ABC transmembrane type-1 domain-containing protein n=1 Tax=Hucho hucho TaxID=62062 RepID=A0A4W5JS13_9TELE
MSDEKPEDLGGSQSVSHDVNESKDQLVTQEGSQEGSVTWRTYHQYCKAAGGYILLSLIIIIFICLVGTTAFSNWWLSYWLEQGSGTANMSMSDAGNISLNPELSFYQTVYGLVVVAMLVFSFVKGYSFTKVTLHASSKLHDTMFRNVTTTQHHCYQSHVNRIEKDRGEGQFGMMTKSY